MLHAVFAPLVQPITSLISEFVEDVDKANALKAKIFDQMAAIDLAQIDVNKAGAQHRSIWVAGWRPAVGWICVVALAYHFIIHPIIISYAAYTGVDISNLPVFDIDSMLTIIFGMLGLGSLRSFEKYKGITK